jgi:hypothetical protein
MATAAKKVVGRPFQKGDDPRRNLGGRPPGQSLTAVLRAKLDGGLRDTLTAELETLATSPDIKPEVRLAAIKEWFDRTEGKSISRAESGEPGTFTGLEDVPTPDLLKLVKKSS